MSVVGGRAAGAAAAGIALLFALGAPTALAASGPTAAPPGPRPIPAVQELAEVTGPHVVRLGPSSGAFARGSVGPLRPITGARTTLPVLAHRTDARNRTWLQVRLPGRAMGGARPPATGWIVASGTTPTSTPWHLVVDVATRRVSVFYRGRLLHRFAAIVGAPATPTPLGSFFVEETVAMPANAAGAPFALATSARSAVLQEFEGGPGQTALHGVRNVGGRLGTAVSHGCVRLGDSSITWIAARMGPGVPITIR
ncbi:MAG: ErfK/YbiS/YcfS/YnhG family protein [Thermoleophilia bacterium]|nr:ErfK/YbiS/YcfS/YnhG family protein [Thermoleophilia bacterium]